MIKNHTPFLCRVESGERVIPCVELEDKFVDIRSLLSKDGMSDFDERFWSGSGPFQIEQAWNTITRDGDRFPEVQVNSRSLLSPLLAADVFHIPFNSRSLRESLGLWISAENDEDHFLAEASPSSRIGRPYGEFLLGETTFYADSDAQIAFVISRSNIDTHSGTASPISVEEARNYIGGLTVVDALVDRRAQFPGEMKMPCNLGSLHSGSLGIGSRMPLVNSNISVDDIGDLRIRSKIGPSGQDQDRQDYRVSELEFNPCRIVHLLAKAGVGLRAGTLICCGSGPGIALTGFGYGNTPTADENCPFLTRGDNVTAELWSGSDCLAQVRRTMN